MKGNYIKVSSPTFYREQKVSLSTTKITPVIFGPFLLIKSSCIFAYGSCPGLIYGRPSLRLRVCSGSTPC